jgi:alanine racemase
MATTPTTFSPAEIAELTGAQLVAGEGAVPIASSFVFDTRKLVDPSGAVFLALRGERRDGHAYCLEAYARGVRLFWVEAPQTGLTGAWQLVNPQGVLPALQVLAAKHRSRMRYPVVGITGSNGKTIVKEWIATLLDGSLDVAKSPSSYNSQLGVALALLELTPAHEVAIIECGISRRGEMAALAAMVQPTLGVLTHFGDAHAEGFASAEEKLSEKLLLFSRCPEVLASSDDAAIASQLKAGPWQWLGVGSEGNYLSPMRAQPTATGWDVQLSFRGEAFSLVIAQPGQAALENAVIAVGVALRLGLSIQTINARIGNLQAVSLRSEMITDNPELTVIADAYNADAASARQAFALLEASRQHPRKRLILTDLEHQGPRAAEVQAELIQLAVARFGADAIELVGPLSVTLGAPLGIRAFPTTEALLAEFDYARYVGATVLLKGARRYALEQLLNPLSRHPGATTFRINLDAVVHNLRTIRRQLPAQTKVMCMLKAAAYGAGAWQLAQHLDREGVDAYGVAFTAEGIDLRQHGIGTAIVVLNADVPSLAECLAYQLEPALGSLEFIRSYGQAVTRAGLSTAPLHLEFDTGMGRLGLPIAEAEAAVRLLQAHPQLEVRSVFTHLAAADEPEADAFTLGQLSDLQTAAAVVRRAFPAAGLHALHTAGILRFAGRAEAAGFDWVRLGIGLYGVSPVPELQSQLQEVGTLSTRISQIHSYAAGTSVGYGRAERLQRASRIATLPIGYADGLPRRLGNRKLSVLVRGEWAPVVGRICMDMLMIDVTDIASCTEGDEVVIIGQQGEHQQSVVAVAELAETIPYELLAGLSSRIRRVYQTE